MDGQDPLSPDGDATTAGSPMEPVATSSAVLIDDEVEPFGDLRSDDPAVEEFGGGEPPDGDLTDEERNWQFVSRCFSFVVVAACCIYIFWVAHPELIFRNTTPTGGDMGAHVWGPAYLRDELLPNFRVTGWTTDWYAGFPAYTFYMVIPSLLIVALDVGFVSTSSLLGVLGALLIVGAAAYLAWELRRHTSRLVRFLGWTACIFVPLLSIDIDYNIAFKMVAVSGIVGFPAGVWFMLKAMSLRRPGPELGAVASVAFLMDKSLFHIYGGNVASTMAGEFAFSMSITLSLFALGAIAMGIRTGRYRARASLLVALAMLCHVIPGLFFMAAGAIFLVALRPRLATFKWALPVGFSGGLMALWWYLPFYGRSSFLNDMGWEKLGVEITPQSWARVKVVNALRGVGATVGETSCAAITTTTNWEAMKRSLLPLYPRTADDPNMWNGKFFFILAAVGVVLSLVMVVRAGVWLTLITSTAAIAFVVMPQHRFWNARVLPFYYLGIYLLAAVGVALLIKALVLVFRGRWVDPHPTVSIAVTGLAMVVMWAGMGMTLRSLPGGTLQPADPVTGVQAYQWLGLKSTYVIPVRDWAKWNFQGLEAKPGNEVSVADPNDPSKVITTLDTTSSDEYFGMIDMMRTVGRDEGCGRAFWEYDGALDKYGTPMAPMLLPYFTDHCIGSMEGLYFEASSTTPFHFLVQSELSQAPSRPERFDCNLGFETSPYSPFNLDLGIKHLQMLGVKYYMAITDASKQAASGDPRLTKVGESGPWQVFEVADVELVTPLENMPVVWDDVEDDIYSWARPAIDWFNDESQWNVFRASSGPDEWERVSAAEPVDTERVPAKVKVSNVKTTNDSISFDVDKVGSPVLIRSSYFPNWSADGADSVDRVTPNFMVVTPTSKRVTLSYGHSSMEFIAAFLSLIGAVMLIGFVVRRPKAAFPLAGEFFGDREPPEPDPESDPEPEISTDHPGQVDGPDWYVPDPSGPSADPTDFVDPPLPGVAPVVRLDPPASAVEPESKDDPR